MEKTIKYLESLFADKSDAHYTHAERKEHNGHLQKAIDVLTQLHNQPRTNAQRWFESLDILKRIKVATFYTDATHDNTNISDGLTEEAINWIVKNYQIQIREFIKQNTIKS